MIDIIHLAELFLILWHLLEHLRQVPHGGLKQNKHRSDHTQTVLHLTAKKIILRFFIICHTNIKEIC